MKYLLIPLALVAGTAFACPGGSKDAMAEPSAKPVLAKSATVKPVVATTKAVHKVATKPAPESVKVARS